ncbi:MAG: zinc-dependent metalloprotease, partial [Bacteroidia bacterium]
TASTAYRPDQISDPKWVMQHGFTTSITDNSEFNFLMKPGNQKHEKLFIPSIGAYDHFAINWAYRQDLDRKTVPSFLNKGKIDSNYFYAAEDKNNVLTQANDLSNDLLKSAEMGIAKLPVFYPKLEEIALKMKDDSWDTYMLIAANFITTYDQYVASVLPNIGGKQSRVVMKNYNEIPFVFIPKATQQQTFDFLNTQVLQGVPSWTINNRAQSLDGSNTERLILKTATKVVNTITSAETLTDLLAAEESGQQNIFGTAELFENINRYIFKNFDPTVATTRYTRSIQSKTVKNMIDLAAKNKLGAGLNELTGVVNNYITFLQDKIDLMGKTHTDPTTKAHYQLLKIQLKNEYLTK